MNKYIAHFAGASVFCLSLIAALQIIIYVTIGKTIDWQLLIPLCLGLSFVSLFIFGNSVVMTGHTLLDFIGIEFEHEKVNQGIAYLSGGITILTVIVNFALVKTYFMTPEKLLSWTSYASAYAIIIICFVFASISYACLYRNSRSTH